MAGTTIDKGTKKKLLDLLQNISYGFDAFAEDLESDEDFWKYWSEMHKFISDIPESSGI